jgi:AcrR family transcriptional regulator
MTLASVSAPTPTGAWRVTEPTVLSPILTEALDAFRENGFHGTSVRDIARRVGVTVPALYYYHENKEAILVALLDPAITELQERCRASVADAGDDVDQQFFNLVECLMLHVTHNARLAHLDNDIQALSPDARQSYTRKRRTIEDLLASVIATGAASGHFDAEFPAGAAKAVLGMLTSVAVWFRPTGRRSAEQVAAAYVLLATRTIGARPAVVRRARKLLEGVEPGALPAARSGRRRAGEAQRPE